MIQPDVLTKIVATLTRHWSPPARPQSLLEFAGTLRLTEGPEERDPYRPAGHPAQHYLLDALGRILNGDLPFQRVIVVKPTQDGGTWTTVTMPCLYVTTQLHQPYIAGFPDLRLASYVWRQKVRKAIDLAKRLDWLPSEGPGSDGSSTPTEIALAGTPCYWIGAGTSNEAGQAGITARVLTRDELDSMDTYVAELMRARLDSFGVRGVTIDTSTIKHDEHSPVLAALSKSTNGRLHFACIHCGAFQRWDWEQVEFDHANPVAAAASARIRCAHCKAALTDAERKATLALDRSRLVAAGQACAVDGTVTGEPVASMTWGILWTALDSPRITLARLAAQWVEAESARRDGDHSLMRRFSRDRLCRPYLADRVDGAALDVTALALRSASATYNRATVPVGVRWITATVDVQKRELWWQAIAHGDGGRWWILDWGRDVVVEDFRGEPTPDHVAAALDRVAARVAAGWPSVETGEILRPLLRGVDVGYQPDAVRDWLALQQGAWLAVRGSGDGVLSDRPKGKSSYRLEGWLDIRTNPDGSRVHYAEADLIKHTLVAALARTQGQPGAGHLPAGQAADDWLIKQLCAEHFKEGKWVKRRKDNHLLDLTVYNLALGRLAAETGAGQPAASVDDLAEALSGFARSRRGW